jgi:hypothetical protein
MRCIHSVGVESPRGRGFRRFLYKKNKKRVGGDFLLRPAITKK